MAAPLDDIPPSIRSSILLKQEEKKKKNNEGDDWFSCQKTGLEPYEALSVLVIQNISSNPAAPAAMVYQIDGSNAPPKTVGFPGYFCSKYPVEILGSCNDFVALYQHGMACLFNPNIDTPSIWCQIPEVSLILRLMCFSPQLFGLCYDPDDDEYTGLVCDVEPFSDPVMIFMCVLKFGRETCSYKTQSGLPNLSSLSRNTGTVVKGVPYWICEDFRDTLILKFDSKTEQLKILPRLPNRQTVSSLGTLDGELTATICDGEDMEIWTIKKSYNENWYDWTPMFVLPHIGLCVSTLSWMIKDVQVLVETKGGKFFVCNVKEGRHRLLSLKLQKKIRASNSIAVAYASRIPARSPLSSAAHFRFQP